MIIFNKWKNTADKILNPSYIRPEGKLGIKGNFSNTHRTFFKKPVTVSLKGQYCLGKFLRNCSILKNKIAQSLSSNPSTTEKRFFLRK
jgi:hypothetical protein